MSATHERLEDARAERARRRPRQGNAVPGGLRPRRRRALRVGLGSLLLALAALAVLHWRERDASGFDTALALELADPARVGAGGPALPAEPAAEPAAGARLLALALERDPSGTRLRIELDGASEHRLRVAGSGRELELLLRGARVERELERLDFSGTEIAWLDLRPEPPDLRLVLGLRAERSIASASYPGAHGSTLVLDLLPPGASETGATAEPPPAAPEEPAERATSAAGASVKRPARRVDADSRYTAALAAERVGRLDEALGELAAVLESQPSHAAARIRLAQLRAAAGAHEDALRVLREGRELDPAQPELALLEARLLAASGEVEAALAALEPVPGSARGADFHALQGALLARQGAHPRAIEAFRAALAREPRRGTTWLGLAISLEAEGRAAEARSAYVRALQAGGIEPAARAWAEERQARLGVAP